MLVNVVTRPCASPRHAALTLLLLLVACVPVLAQTDLSGSWGAKRHEDLGNAPLAVDYLGLPLNDEGRIKALAYSSSQLSMIERQCQGWAPYYLAQGPFGMKIWNQTDPVSGATLAWIIGAWEDRPPTTIWMDGRPHPSKSAPHPREGFTTGTWEGDTLVAYTTHVKASQLRRNGAPSSDEATVTTRFIRHGDLLTVLVVVEDPVYLSEPFFTSKGYQLDAAVMAPVGPPCVQTYEGTSGEIPHYLPGRNPFVDEMTKRYGIPQDAVLGRPETNYPEYRKKMKETHARPER